MGLLGTLCSIFSISPYIWRRSTMFLKMFSSFAQMLGRVFRQMRILIINHVSGIYWMPWHIHTFPSFESGAKNNEMRLSLTLVVFAFVLWALFCFVTLLFCLVFHLWVTLFYPLYWSLPILRLQSPNAGFPGGPVIKNTPANAGEWVWSLVWEDPACLGATKAIHYSNWAYAPEPGNCNYWSLCAP